MAFSIGNVDNRISTQSCSQQELNRATDDHNRSILENKIYSDIKHKEFADQVKNHLLDDMSDLERDMFDKNDFPDRTIEKISSISLTNAGEETHGRGKVPLFIDIEFDVDAEIKDETDLRIIYKPRSLGPDKIVDNVTSRINGRNPRAILDKEDHGYDSCIEGSTLGKKPLPYSGQTDFSSKKLEDFCLDRDSAVVKDVTIRKENANLMLILKELGIEDTHKENFIADKDLRLHFIDAEVHGTKTSADTSEICEKIENNCPDLDLNKHKEFIKDEKDKLQTMESRVILCSTNFYTGPYAYSVNTDVGNVEVLLEESKPTSFDDEEEKLQFLHSQLKIRQRLGLANFMHEKGLITFEEGQENISLNDLEHKMKEALREDSLSALDEELKNEREGFDGVPAFYFNPQKNCLRLPLQGTEIQFKELEAIAQEEMTKSPEGMLEQPQEALERELSDPTLERVSQQEVQLGR